MTRTRTNTASILLMGPRASGKSTVGALLAKSLQRPFIDLDQVTLAAFADCDSVSQAWREHGEAAWRKAEAAALEKVLQSSGQVIALGGGTPMIAQSQRLLGDLKASHLAFIVYLQADAGVLRHRLLSAAGDRPPLKGTNAVNEISQILREREPVYRALANLIVDATASADDIVACITAAIRK